MKLQLNSFKISNLAPVYCIESPLIGRYLQQTTTACLHFVSVRES